MNKVNFIKAAELKELIDYQNIRKDRKPFFRRLINQQKPILAIRDGSFKGVRVEIKDSRYVTEESRVGAYCAFAIDGSNHSLSFYFKDYNIDYSQGTNGKIAFGTLMLLGKGTLQIELWNNDYIAKMKPIVIETLFDKVYNLKIRDNCSVFGYLYDKNKYLYTIEQDSFILKNGYIVNEKSIEAAINEKGLDAAKQLIDLVMLDAQDFNYANESFAFKNMLNSWKYFIKAKHQISIQNSKLSLVSSPVKALEDYEIDNSYKDIINEFKSYQYDLVKMMEQPILANLNDPEVKKFNKFCKRIERQEIEINYIDFETEWESLLSYAAIKRHSMFDSQQKRKLKDSRTMLDKALNEASTESEKIASIKGLTANLENILPLDEKVISWIKQNTGVKEITV